MKNKAREYWIPILLAIPIGIFVNILTSFVDIRLSIIIALLTAIIIIYLVISDKLLSWINERNRQGKIKEAQQLEEEMERIRKLRDDIPKLVTRITWDLSKLFIFSSFLTIMVLITVVISQREIMKIDSPMNIMIFTIVLYGILFFYALELKRDYATFFL